MLDLFGDVLTTTKPVRKRGPSKPSRPMAPITGGMFPLTDTLSPERFSAVFHSGATAYYDALALIALNKDVGVVADLLVPRVEHLLREYVLKGGAVFVDSGAYSAYKKWETGEASSPQADMDAVLNTYDRLIAGLPTNFPSGFSMVMPDVLKQPELSLELLERYRDRVVRLIDAGVNAIVPLQRGAQRAGETAERVFEILGTRNVTLGIPSAAAAMSPSDAATIRNHDRFHILGRATMGMPLYQRCYAVLEHNPGSTISCDANLIRKRTPELTVVHHELIRVVDTEVWQGCFEETELIYQVMHDTAWMSKPQITALAHFYGLHDRATVRDWIRAHNESEDGLAPLIEEVDPEAMMLWSTGLRKVFFQHAKEEMSALLRAHAIEEVFNSEGPLMVPFDAEEFHSEGESFFDIADDEPYPQKQFAEAA